MAFGTPPSMMCTERTPSRTAPKAATTRGSISLPMTPSSNRASAMLIDECRQFLIELAQRHFDDRQCALVGDAQSAITLPLESHLPHELVDVPTAAVHDDRLHADEPKQRDVARETGLERRIGHRATAEADHDRLAVERSD